MLAIDSKRITLKHDRGFTFIDLADWEREFPATLFTGRVIRFRPCDVNWRLTPRGYAATEHCHDKRATTILLHRLVTGAPKGMQVDHINGLKLDNRQANLRICTQSQNMRNMIRPPSGKSKFRGVWLNTRSGKWVAGCRFQGHTKNLGTYSTEEDAARAYDAFVIAHFGSFASPNFPETSHAETPFPTN